MDHILKAHENILLSEQYKSELAISRLQSKIISRKITDLLQKTMNNADRQSLFQEIVISDSRSIREVVNIGQRSIHDFIPLLNKKHKFSNWLVETGDSANFIKEYISVITNEKALQRLPSKIIRFVVFNTCNLAIAALTDPITGIALGLAGNMVDTFLVDSLKNGWSPSQYIAEINRVMKRQ